VAEPEKLTRVYRHYLVGTLGVFSVLIVGMALWRLRDVALMVALAGFLAYFLSWPVRWLGRWFRQQVAVRIVFYTSLVVVGGILGPIGGVFYGQVVGLVESLPRMVTGLERSLQNLSIELLPGHELRFIDYLNQFAGQLQANSPRIVSSLLGFTQSFVSGTAVFAIGLIVVPLITLYLLLDSTRLRQALMGCFPRHVQPDVHRALDAVNRSLSAYIYSKTILALFIGLAMGASLAILGLPFAGVLGLIAFLGEFVPVIGAWIAFSLMAVVAIATDPWDLLWICIIMIVSQIVQTYVIAPKLMGDTMDMHPLTVVLAMLVGGTLGGVAGLIISIPAFAAAKIILNVFVFRRREPGIALPSLDLISQGGGPADIREST